MIPVIHLGLGDIGKGTIAAIFRQREWLQLVAVVDVNPALARRELRSLIPGPGVPQLKVCSSISEALRAARKKPVVATLTTSSQTAQVKETIEALIAAGIHTVSSCEELAFPELRARKITAGLDAQARRKGVAILATGVNPGFAMDAFALACTAPCISVRNIKVVRSLDAAKRRPQLQKKIGAGMTLSAVNRLIKQDAIGHVGLGESVAMIAAGLGWKLERITQKFTAVVAEHAVASEHFKIKPGEVRGLHMVAAGIVNGKTRIALDLLMAFGAATFDEVTIDGDPDLVVKTTTGFPGEASTIGLLVNCIRVAPTQSPGMRTMLDVLKVRGVGAS